MKLNYEQRYQLSSCTKNIKKNKFTPCYIYVPCEGNIHVIQRMEDGALHFHNHDIKSLKAQVYLDILHTEQIKNTELTLGCALALRFLSDPKRQEYIRDASYSANYFWSNGKIKDPNIINFFDSSIVKSLFYSQAQGRTNNRKTIKDILKVPEAKERFSREAYAILSRVWNIVEYNSEKEFRGKYVTSSSSPMLRLTWEIGTDVRLGTSDDDVPTVFLGSKWLSSVFFKGMAIFNNKLITKVIKRHYDNCYTVQMVVNSRGFDLVQKTYRIYILGSNDVEIETFVRGETINMFAYKKYGTMKVLSGRMEEVK